MQKAIEQGSEQAKQILDEMNAEKQLKSINKNNKNLIHCINKKGSDLYETPKFKDDSYTSFFKSHTIICCPACREKIVE